MSYQFVRVVIALNMKPELPDVDSNWPFSVEKQQTLASFVSDSGLGICSSSQWATVSTIKILFFNADFLQNSVLQCSTQAKASRLHIHRSRIQVTWSKSWAEVDRVDFCRLKLTQVNIPFGRLIAGLSSAKVDDKSLCGRYRTVDCLHQPRRQKFPPWLKFMLTVSKDRNLTVRV